METHDAWEELLRRIADYIFSRTPKQLEQLDKDLDIKEYLTPFGVLRVKQNLLFARYYDTIASATRVRKLSGDFITDPMPCSIDDIGTIKEDL